jgi:hypothetical protein
MITQGFAPHPTKEGSALFEISTTATIRTQDDSSEIARTTEKIGGVPPFFIAKKRGDVLQ